MAMNIHPERCIIGIDRLNQTPTSYLTEAKASEQPQVKNSGAGVAVSVSASTILLNVYTC